MVPSWIKSRIRSADATFVSLMLGSIFSAVDAKVICLGVAAWLVLMCLKAIAGETALAMRWHNLMVESHKLRQQQLQRIKALGMKTKA